MGEESIISATAEYGEEFVVSFEAENISATQFHPEKSQEAGLKLLDNWRNGL